MIDQTPFMARNGPVKVVMLKDPGPHCIPLREPPAGRLWNRRGPLGNPVGVARFAPGDV